MGASASVDELKGDSPRILEVIRFQLKKSITFALNPNAAILKQLNYLQLWNAFLAFETQSFALTKTELKSVLLASLTLEASSEK